MPWTAEPRLRADHPDVALVQPGDGRDPEKHPFAQGPVMHLMSPEAARALAASLVHAAEVVEGQTLPPMWMCPIAHGATLSESTYLAPGECMRCGQPMVRVTDALAQAALCQSKATPS